MSQLALTYSRREWILELLLLLAEGTLVWIGASLLFAPFTSNPDPVPSWFAIGLAITAGVLPRFLHDRGVWGRTYTTIVAAAIVLSILVAIRSIAFPGEPWFDTAWLQETAHSLVFEESSADIIVWGPIGLSLAVWWLARFHGPPGLERCRSGLRSGAAMSALVAIASAVVDVGPGDREIALAIGLFFAASLIALAIARQGHDVTHSHRLLTTVLLPTLAIVAGATLLAALGTFDYARATPDSLAPLGVVLDPIFQVLLVILTVIVILISLPLFWLLSLGNFNPPQIRDTIDAGDGSSNPSALDWNPPDPVRYVLAMLFLLLIICLIARFVLALTRRDFERSQTGEQEFGSRRGFGAWLERFRWPFGRSSPDPLAGLRGEPAWANTVRVRETYAAWLRWAQEHKFGRDTAETALELDHRTGAFLRSPAAISALDELTAVYDDVRYSAVPATSAQADRAVRAWNQLKQAESTYTKR